ncbi:MAG TPA: GspH/FimT family pseudopilin [Stellaceae bacterium]|nr:GspH/FimT family pseudopilin [Stellaceae bacterium]
MIDIVTRRDPSGERGFTLIELLVVLTISALLFGLTIELARGPQPRTLLPATARQVASAFRAAREQAITQDRLEVVMVDVASGAWVAPGAVRRHLPRGVRAVLFTEDTDTDGDERGLIRFYPDGSSSGGGLSIEAGGLRYDILVDWLTGGVTIHEQRPVPRKPAIL